jgi:hypothetical protein
VVSVKWRSLSAQQRRWLKRRRRQAVEPAIGHTKQDHGVPRCWLKGSDGDALQAVIPAAGFNIRWLMRASPASAWRAFQCACASFLIKSAFSGSGRPKPT